MSNELFRLRTLQEAINYFSGIGRTLNYFAQVRWQYSIPISHSFKFGASYRVRV